MTNALSHSFIYVFLRSKTCIEKKLFLDSHFHYRKVSFLSILQHKSHKFKSTVSKTMNIMHSDLTMHPHFKMLSTDADRKYIQKIHTEMDQIVGCLKEEEEKKKIIFFFLITTYPSWYIGKSFYIANGSVCVFFA